MDLLKKALLAMSLAVCILAGCSKMTLNQAVDSLIDGKFEKNMDSLEQTYVKYYDAEQKVALSGKAAATSPDDPDAAINGAYESYRMLADEYQFSKAALIDEIMKVLVEKGYAKTIINPQMRQLVNLHILDALRNRIAKPLKAANGAD